jgi:transcription elongation factor Elf1
MLNYEVYEEKELVRVGVVCPHCNTESVFDLSKDQTANVGRECPGCGDSEFLRSFQTEAKQSYNWVTYYKRVKEISKKV